MSARSRSVPWFRVPREHYETAIAQAPALIAIEYRFFFCVRCGFPAWLEDEDGPEELPEGEHNGIVSVSRENEMTRVNGIVLLNPLLCSMCFEKEAA